MPDFARYATDPSATMWTHIIFVPFPAAIVSIPRADVLRLN